MSKPVVWVVEMLMDVGKWLPCSECALTRDAARMHLDEYRAHNSADKFRLRQYARVEKRRK